MKNGFPIDSFAGEEPWEEDAELHLQDERKQLPAAWAINRRPKPERK